MAGLLADKVALVTGGAAGIGKAIVERFVKEDATVVFTDVNEEAGKQVEDELGTAKAVFLKQDTSKEADWQHVVDETEHKFGPIDILVNNAGVFRLISLADTTEEQWDWLMNIDAKGVFFGMKTVVPKMAARKTGAVVNMSSIAGLGGSAEATLYGGAKGAVRMMTKDVAIEYAGQGVRVNSVHPGLIDTEMADYAAGEYKAEKNSLGQMHPMGRLGKPEEIANAVTFLASDEASFITGVELPVDGGFTAQ